MRRRTWGVSEQKIVAAAQQWRCASCDLLLPAAYELDHVVPLWKGGKDCHETNAAALCPNCHAEKTQKENIERQMTLRKNRLFAYRSSLPPPIRTPPALSKDEDEHGQGSGDGEISSLRFSNAKSTAFHIEDSVCKNRFLRFAHVKGGKMFGFA